MWWHCGPRGGERSVAGPRSGRYVWGPLGLCFSKLVSKDLGSGGGRC